MVFEQGAIFDRIDFNLNLTKDKIENANMDLKITKDVL